ncbi:MAG: hypothetical protein PHF60_05680 [Candidatus ainarchaeum sp.]|nr:hypothetical protein [Candidatus ainarchaeum sp.]
MHDANLNKIAGVIVRSTDPVARGKQVLLDAYKRTEGIGDTSIRRAALFELVRSKVIQAVYEATEGPPGFREWPQNMILKEELDDAVRARMEYLKSGMRSVVAGNFPTTRDSRLNTLRIALDLEANSVERFLGSTRRYMPGVGYAVSIRKRDLINQDSFALGYHNGAKFMGVADGCGIQRFSSIASYMSLQRAIERSGPFLLDPKAVICDISSEITDILNSPDMKTALGRHGGGSSTLSIGISRDEEQKILRVGDSIGFRIYSNHGVGPKVEALQLGDELDLVMGHWRPLRTEDIEEHSRKGGQLVLTTDGTDFIKDIPGLLVKLAVLTDNCVLIAERIVREVLRIQIETNQADDVTVVVQEAKEN